MALFETSQRRRTGQRRACVVQAAVNAAANRKHLPIKGFTAPRRLRSASAADYVRGDLLLEPMTLRIFLGAIEILAAASCGRLSGSALGRVLSGIASADRPGVRATVRIVRFTIAYLAIATMTWTVALSNLPLLHQTALVMVAALVGGGALTPATRR